MAMVWQEMKKIFSIRKILYLVVFGLLFFSLFLRPYVQSAMGSYHMEADMVRSFMAQYGARISPEEFQEWKQSRPVYEGSSLDGYIAANEDFGSLGIHSFVDLVHGNKNGFSLEDENRLWWALQEAFPQVNLGEEMERLLPYEIWDYYLAAYEQEALSGGTGQYTGLDQKQQRRVAERNAGEVYGTLPSNVAYYNFEVLRFMGVFLVLALIILVFPYMVAENRSRMPALQYSFRQGRATYWHRLAAVVASCLVMTALVMAVYARIAVRNQVTSFWDCSLSCFSSGFIGWHPWTLGQNILSHLAVVAAFSLGMALAVFVATCHLENYITAIAWLLPAGVGGVVFCGLAMFRFDEITRPKGLTLVAGGLMLAAGVTAALVQGGVEGRRDIQVF